MGRAGLQLNLEKSCFMIVGSKMNRKKLLEKVKKAPIKLGDVHMKEVKVMKFLGDSLSMYLEESVHQTVVKRAAVARQTIYEIRTVIEDPRAGSVGALGLAFDIWEQGILPMILWNSGSWIGISKRSMKVLDRLFRFFLPDCA